MAASGTLFALWGGRMEKWRPPDEVLPGTAQKLVFLLCGVGVVLQWYLAGPDVIDWYLAGVVVLAISTLLLYLKYNSLLGSHTYIIREAVGPCSTREVRIIGGRKLLPDAERIRQEQNLDIQAMLEGAGQSPTKIWDPKDIQWVKDRILLVFILMLVFGTSALTGAGLLLQLLLTQ